MQYGFSLVIVKDPGEINTIISISSYIPAASPCLLLATNIQIKINIVHTCALFSKIITPQSVH